MKNSRIDARGSERREARRCDEPSLGESQIPAEPPSRPGERLQWLFSVTGLSKVVERRMIGASRRCRGVEEWEVRSRKEGESEDRRKEFAKLDGQRLYWIDDERMFPVPRSSEKNVLTP
jgi:hypothetical protein